MNNPKEIAIQFVYLLQVSSPSQSYSITSLVLSNTNLISSVLAIITLTLLLVSITTKANISRKIQIKQKREQEKRAEELKAITSIEESARELQASKRFKRVEGTDKEALENLIKKAEELRRLREETQI
jgi:uncharacterized membrane protein